MSALCRDCGTFMSIAHAASLRPPERCAVCGSPRLIVHGELDRLAIAHIDCDAFYASVEKRDRPEIANQPVIVGGGRRGVVLTACYLARQSGVHSAMPMFQALKLCRDAMIVKPDMKKYAAEGRRVRALMQSVTPLVEPVSIDEAYLDLSGTERLHRASPAETLARLCRRIEAEIGVTVSVGLSFHRVLAKIASGLDKPRGFSVIGHADALEKLDRLPIRELPGVGPAAERALAKSGIASVGALRRSTARTRLAPGAADLLAEIESGRAGRAIAPDRPTKSISAETTFASDIASIESLAAELWPLCERVSARLKTSMLAAETVQIVLRTADFRRINRQRAVHPPTQLAAILFDVSAALLKETADGRPYRLIGVGASNLVGADAADHGDLLDGSRARKLSLERAIDDVRARLGPGAIATGRSLKKP